MMTIPNCISLLRIPLAFLFLQQNVFYRLLAIFISMISDGLDGYIARRTKCCTRVGTTLDPMTDKFFVFFVMGILLQEQRLTWFEAICMMCRDFSNILYALYLILTRQWDNYRFRAIWCGKLTTFFQFLILLSLTYGVMVPEYAYKLFILLGVAALGEFYVTGKFRKNIVPSTS